MPAADCSGSYAIVVLPAGLPISSFYSYRDISPDGEIREKQEAFLREKETAASIARKQDLLRAKKIRPRLG
jgi:hypothetical protein